MQLLLDTHTLIWMGTQPGRFSSSTTVLLEDESNVVYASIISLWELAIKISIGKLDMGNNWLQDIQHFMRENAIDSMPIKPQHCDRSPAGQITAFGVTILSSLTARGPVRVTLPVLVTR